MQPATGSDQMTNSGAGGPGHVYRPALYLSFCGPCSAIVELASIDFIITLSTGEGKGGLGSQGLSAKSMFCQVDLTTKPDSRW